MCRLSPRLLCPLALTLYPLPPGRSLLADVDVGDASAPDPWPAASSWKVSLKLLMLAPTQHVERVTWGGVYFRLSRHYASLLVAVFVGWVFKLYEHAGGVATHAPTVACVAGVYVLVGLVAYGFRPVDGGLSLPGTGPG